MANPLTDPVLCRIVARSKKRFLSFERRQAFRLASTALLSAPGFRCSRGNDSNFASHLIHQVNQLGRRHPYTLAALASQAWVLQCLSELDEAENLFQETLTCRREQLGLKHMQARARECGIVIDYYFFAV